MIIKKIVAFVVLEPEKGVPPFRSAASIAPHLDPTFTVQIVYRGSKARLYEDGCLNILHPEAVEELHRLSPNPDYVIIGNVGPLKRELQPIINAWPKASFKYYY